MAEILKPDICVIGAGSAGLSVAAIAAAFGVPTVLIERGAMGGECLNVGCVPSKAMLAAARRAHEARTAGAFGISTGPVEADFVRVLAHVRAVIASIAPSDSAERFTAMGVRVIRAQARFRGKRSVEAGGFTIRARRFVIATGSAPAIPPIPGLPEIPYFTNETIFGNERRPDHLIVIGGGPIGLELAQAHRRLGSQVSVIEARKVLGRDDPEAAMIVRDALIAEGVQILERATVRSVTRAGEGVAATVSVEGGEERLIEGSHLLLATGRRPFVDGLDIFAAGIGLTDKGIWVDRRLRTTNSRVYAIGDVIDGPQFTHMGNYQAGIVVRQILFRLPARPRSEIVPWVTFTDPELAQVGLSEEQARARHRSVRILRWPYHENDRAQTERATRGFIKVVTTRKGRILGATIVGREAGEIINMWSLAVSAGLGIRAFTNFISPYPTLAEIGKRAAVAFYTPRLTSPWLRRTLKILRRFG